MIDQVIGQAVITIDDQYYNLLNYLLWSQSCQSSSQLSFEADVTSGVTLDLGKLLTNLPVGIEPDQAHKIWSIIVYKGPYKHFNVQ